MTRAGLLFVGVAWLTVSPLTAHVMSRGAVVHAQAGAEPDVWAGIFTEQQAQRGGIAYQQSCASCHAEDLRGSGTAPSLIEETFAFQWDDVSVGDFLVRIRTLMPSDRPSSLPAQTYRDIVAFILRSNHFPVGDKELDADLEMLRRILIRTKRPEPRGLTP